MNTHADKTQENKSQSVESNHSQMQSDGESTFQFVDNRPEAVAQRKLQETVNNSPRAIQLKAIQEMANSSLQAKQATQFQSMADNHSSEQQQPIQKNENNTGLPDNLKTGIENLSGMSLFDVKVHYNSDKPAQLQAHAYAQGTGIHLAPGQEKHLPHEAWHVVQQKQGRVKPTLQLKNKVNVNDDAALEKEADEMGAEALKKAASSKSPAKQSEAGAKDDKTRQLSSSKPIQEVMQMALLTAASGDVRLDAEQYNGHDLYMWNTDQREGEDPGDAIGSTNVFTDWAGAEDSTGSFHRAHAYGKQFGGGGAATNVAWWTTDAEDAWTPLEDRMRGDNNGGNAANWTPGVGEYGNYRVTRTLQANLNIVARYRTPLISAIGWGLHSDRNVYQDMIAGLDSDELRAEANVKRLALIANIAATVDAFLDLININAAAALIIERMAFSYTRTANGANPGASRANINQAVDNTHGVDDFGLLNDDAAVWNAIRTFGGMFHRGRQGLGVGLTARLTAPAPTTGECAVMRAQAIAELKAEGIAAGQPPDFQPGNAAIGPRFGQKMIAWRAAHPQVTLGPIANGWGAI